MTCLYDTQIQGICVRVRVRVRVCVRVCMYVCMYVCKRHHYLGNTQHAL
jgi:hypothetical protein